MPKLDRVVTTKEHIVSLVKQFIDKKREEGLTELSFKQICDSLQEGQIDGTRYTISHLQLELEALIDNLYPATWDKRGRQLIDISEFESKNAPDGRMLGAPFIGLETKSVIQSTVRKHKPIRHGGATGSSDQGKMRTG